MADILLHHLRVLNAHRQIKHSRERAAYNSRQILEFAEHYRTLLSRLHIAIKQFEPEVQARFPEKLLEDLNECFVYTHEIQDFLVTKKEEK